MLAGIVVVHVGHGAAFIVLAAVAVAGLLPFYFAMLERIALAPMNRPWRRPSPRDRRLTPVKPIG
jgi:hypothetical protein